MNGLESALFSCEIVQESLRRSLAVMNRMKDFIFFPFFAHRYTHTHTHRNSNQLALVFSIFTNELGDVRWQDKKCGECEKERKPGGAHANSLFNYEHDVYVCVCMKRIGRLNTRLISFSVLSLPISIRRIAHALPFTSQHTHTHTHAASILCAVIGYSFHTARIDRPRAEQHNKRIDFAGTQCEVYHKQIDFVSCFVAMTAPSAVLLWFFFSISVFGVFGACMHAVRYHCCAATFGKCYNLVTDHCSA